ncbi:carboxymuconolactone decarboxylase family protein [Sphingobium phenoxybenzoativorans]|uniref:Carboxymuconolactone decarboxylase family protein n=2 Tax=Sphingobium phenoxybenzoativorans TaxID=1592790 RepID=A0A975KCB4_9SPHN|nr:carboxymuconolactone decarboxylase family protein [Sphingobium phenoxybenzoativorans]
MHTQLNWMDAQPAAAKAMMALEGAVLKGAIEKPLAELVRMRVSQMNGCAFCMDMHSHDMIKAGENPQRIFVLSGWRDSPVFSGRERAALAWAEAMTSLASGHPDAAAHEALDAHFTDAEKVELTLLIVTINGWNRFGVGFGMVHPLRN